jgi:hypothetical protein
LSFLFFLPSFLPSFPFLSYPFERFSDDEGMSLTFPSPCCPVGFLCSAIGCVLVGVLTFFFPSFVPSPLLLEMLGDVFVLVWLTLIPDLVGDELVMMMDDSLG